MSGARGGLVEFSTPRDSRVLSGGAILVIFLGRIESLKPRFISDDDEVYES